MTPRTADGFAKPSDLILTDWCIRVILDSPASLSHIPLNERQLLSAVVSVCQGTLNLSANGRNRCIQASHLVRHLLNACGGIESHPVAVVGYAHSELLDSPHRILGADQPRLLTNSSGVVRWTGHEIVAVPQWSIMFDLTASQLSQHHRFREVVAEPVVTSVAGSPTPGQQLTATVLDTAASGLPFDLTYTVLKTDRAYRKSPEWHHHQIMLDRAVERGVNFIRECGLQTT